MTCFYVFTLLFSFVVHTILRHSKDNLLTPFSLLISSINLAVDFFNQINMLYGTITEFCTPQDCPVMSAGPKYEYHWKDEGQFKKPARVSAPVYVDHLMSWVQSQLDNETIFPSKIGVEFPPSFQSVINAIFRRLFRVYAHIYVIHFSVVVSLGEEAHLNTSFKHFILFVKEFNLIESKELAPLADLIDSLLAQTKN